MAFILKVGFSVILGNGGFMVITPERYSRTPTIAISAFKLILMDHRNSQGTHYLPLLKCISASECHLFCSLSRWLRLPEAQLAIDQSHPDQLTRFPNQAWLSSGNQAELSPEFSSMTLIISHTLLIQSKHLHKVQVCCNLTCRNSLALLCLPR